ncbi:MAG: M3 family metallopeptidase [Ignavibacteriaceae bacterium]|nr:M3 family metallopeptidase [Ignavibacteriaceae bacterium]
MKKALVLLIIIGSYASNVFTQDNFIAIPKEERTKYHINFIKLFYSSPEAERQSYSSLKEMITRLEGFKGKVANSGTNLLSALVLDDSITVQYSLHDAYLYLSFAVNTKEAVISDYESELIAEVNSRTQFLQTELMQISEDNLTRLMKEKPELNSYLFEIESAQRLQHHTLPLNEEERLGNISPSITDWQYELYQNLITHINFTKVKTESGEELNVWSQRGTIMNNPDRNVRESGFKFRFSDIAKQKDLFAFALIKLIKAKDALSQLHNYKDYAEESYFSRYLSVSGVRDLLNKVEEKTSVLKKFETIRARHIKNITGYDDVNYWDLSGGTTKSPVPRFEISQATKIILNVIHPLGTEYESEMAALLDPSNGRLDIVSGDNRLSGGGGVGFPGIPNVFYSQGYEGFYKDMSILIHEGGHVAHFQLMGKNNIKPVYGTGPNYFSESFAIFNELLLADYLYKNEKDISNKIFYLEQFLDVKGLEVFRAAQESQLEQSIHDGVASNKIQNADDLDTLTLNIFSKYSIWPKKHPDEFKETWMVSRLMYEDPMYLINYVYGALLSLKYYEMFNKDPIGFSTKYLSLMRNGFNDTPSVLLKNFLNIDLNDPHLLNDAMDLLDKKIDDLQKLYSTIDNH